MLSCKQFLTDLHGYFERELDHVQEARMEGHRKACPHCQASYETMLGERLDAKGVRSVCKRHLLPRCLNEETFQQYLAGALSPEETSYVETHAAQCASCGFVLANLAKKQPSTAGTSLLERMAEKTKKWLREAQELIPLSWYPHVRVAPQPLLGDGDQEAPVGKRILLSDWFEENVLREKAPWIGDALEIIRMPGAPDGRPAGYVAHVKSRPGKTKGVLHVMLQAEGGKKAECRLTSSFQTKPVEGDGLPSEWTELTLRLLLEE